VSVLTRVVLTTAPTTLTPQVIGPTRIDLSWPAVLGAASYRVYRGGVLVDSPIGLTSSSTGLTPSTLYSFRVSSVGVDGQEGPQGPQASANTTAAADTTAPTAPVLGTPTQSGSNTLIVPMTTASSDASGIASYALERATAAIGPFTLINSAALFPYTDLGLSPSTAYWYRARATDNASNVGAYSNVVTQTTITQSGVIQFTPGHYMWVDTGSGGGGLSGWIAQINSIASEPTIKGVKISLNWDDIEPSTQGVYSFTILDQLVNACAAINKKLMVIIECQYFSDSITNPAGRLPTYVINNGWYWQWDGTGSPSGNLALAVRLDLVACMNAFIAAGQACAARYNTGGTIELWMIGETAMDIPSSTGWSQTNWIARLKAWAAAMRSAWSQTGVRIYTNYLNTDAQMQDLIAFCAVNKITCGGPDNYSRIYQSNPIYTGNNGGIDYRNRIPWASENQRPASSSGGSTATSTQIYAHNETGALVDGGSTRPNYYIWSRPYLGETWSQVLSFIRSIGGACNTTNPYTEFNFYISPTGSDGNPGSLSLPWAITALNTRRATYQGTRVGLLSGTYSIGSLYGPGDYNVPILDVDGSTNVLSPTVIQSVARHGAIIDSQLVGTGTRPAFGNSASRIQANLIIDGLYFTRSVSRCVKLGDYVQAPITGSIILRNCRFSGNDARTTPVTGGNNSCLEISNQENLLVQNNLFQDNIGEALNSADHHSAILAWKCRNNIFEYNTSVTSGSFFGKAEGHSGNIFRYNHIDTSHITAQGMGIADWSGWNTGTGAVTKVHNNVLIAMSPADMRSLYVQGTEYTEHAVEFYNNTCIIVGTNSFGLHIRTSAGLLKMYNNIFSSTATSDHGFFAINTQANDTDGLIDCNVYYRPSGSAQWASYASAGAAFQTRTYYSTLALARSAIGANGLGGIAMDANAATANPVFGMTGTRANLYKLQASSPYRAAGTSPGFIGGLSSGGNCERGAWGGASPPTTIGCDS
jgi:hypothetical protein